MLTTKKRARLFKGAYKNNNAPYVIHFYKKLLQIEIKSISLPAVCLPNSHQFVQHYLEHFLETGGYKYV
jgi:hypothetical protein